MDHIKEFETMVFRLDPVFNIGSRDSQSWMFKFCNAIKKVNIESQSTTMFLSSLRALGLLLADGAPTVGGGKTF